MEQAQRELYLKNLTESKKNYRKHQAALPIEEKMKIVIRMQETRMKLGKARFKPFGQN